MTDQRVAVTAAIVVARLPKGWEDERNHLWFTDGDGDWHTVAPCSAQWMWNGRAIGILPRWSERRPPTKRSICAECRKGLSIAVGRKVRIER